MLYDSSNAASGLKIREYGKSKVFNGQSPAHPLKGRGAGKIIPPGHRAAARAAVVEADNYNYHVC